MAHSFAAAISLSRKRQDALPWMLGDLHQDQRSQEAVKETQRRQSAQAMYACKSGWHKGVEFGEHHERDAVSKRSKSDNKQPDKIRVKIYHGVLQRVVLEWTVNACLVLRALPQPYMRGSQYSE
eukprot:6408600-Amphidinium_carterae.1